MPSARTRAAVRRQQTREQLDGGALAGAVRAGVGDDLAAADGQVDAAQRLDDSHFGAQQVAQDVAAAAPSAPAGGRSCGRRDSSTTVSEVEVAASSRCVHSDGVHG